jgi:hypothetical protein
MPLFTRTRLLLVNSQAERDAFRIEAQIAVSPRGDADSAEPSFCTATGSHDEDENPNRIFDLLQPSCESQRLAQELESSRVGGPVETWAFRFFPSSHNPRLVFSSQDARRVDRATRLQRSYPR